MIPNDSVQGFIHLVKGNGLLAIRTSDGTIWRDLTYKEAESLISCLDANTINSQLKHQQGH